MTVTVSGRLTDSMGVSRHEEVTSAIAPGGHLVARSETRFVALPADSYKDVQPAHIPLDISHDEVIGEVVFIERRANGLYIVASSDVDELADIDDELYLSVAACYRVASRGGSVQCGADAELDGVAVTMSPATYCQTPVTVIPGDLHSAADYARCRAQLRGAAPFIERAEKYRQRRGRYDPHVIATEPRPDPKSTWLTSAPSARSSDSAVTMPALVDRARRLVWLPLSPQRIGRPVRLLRVIAADGHRITEPVGRHIPEHDRPGLACFRLAATRCGNETIELVGDDCLDLTHTIASSGDIILDAA
jgi:hypothetical protein